MCCTFNEIPCLFTASPACSPPLHVPCYLLCVLLFCVSGRHPVQTQTGGVTGPYLPVRSQQPELARFSRTVPSRPISQHNTKNVFYFVVVFILLFYRTYACPLISLRFSRVEGVLSIPRQLTSALEQGGHCRQGLSYIYIYIYVYNIVFILLNLCK